MPRKRPALAQPRPARTVRRRRLQQRPPHLAGREALPAAPVPAEARLEVEPVGPASPPGQLEGAAVPATEALPSGDQAPPTPLAPPAEAGEGPLAAPPPAPPPAPGPCAPEPDLPLLEAEAVVPLSREASVRAALEAHRAWKEALRAAVAGKAALDVKAVLAHDRCALAAWLAGQGRRFAGPGLAEVALWHRRFHAAAAVVAIRAAAGRPWEAARLLEGPSYLSTSASLESALEDLLSGA
jgi:hypothetical protein